MRDHVREKDYRRIGYIFQDDLFLEKNESMMDENWKSVITELHENKIKNKELHNTESTKNIGSSFDSGIQQEYNSDNDEICNSICVTLNRLVELSKEQQLYLKHFENVRSISEPCQLNVSSIKNQQRNRPVDKSNSKNVDTLSMKSNNSEENNLVEEMFMKNSYSAKTTGKFSQTGTIRSQFLSSSAQNLNTAADSNIGNVSQSLQIKRTYAKHNAKTKTLSLNPNAQINISIDIGTMFSGFAYTVEDGDGTGVIHFMKNAKGLQIKKLPSILLLNSKTEFHSFGYEAKEYFLNMEQNIASLSSQWLLFEKFKFQLLNIAEINRESEIKAINGVSISALVVYTRTLNYLKCLALQELSTVLQKLIKKDRIRWIISIPVTWSINGKLFMQEAAYNAGLCTAETIDKLVILYEAEAVAAWCKIFNWDTIINDQSASRNPDYFLVVNCGGGVVDVTVHRTNNDQNICTISEVQKPSEIIFNSLSVNEEFVRLLTSILGSEFINFLILEKLALFTDILYQFESCKCLLSQSVNKVSTASIFINQTVCDFFFKITGKQLSKAIFNSDYEDMTWNDEGAIIVNANLFKKVFQPLVQKIIKFIKQILRNRREDMKISRIYFTGGLTKSQIFQSEIRENLECNESIIFIQNEPELCALKGSIQRVLESESIKYSRSSNAYAVGILKQFQDNVDPIEKLVLKNGHRWCCDFLDGLIRKDQLLQEGEVILKRYTPTTCNQSHIIINIYSVEHENSKFVTDNGVHNCGVLHLPVTPSDKISQHEILLQLIFTGQKFIANALDTSTGCYSQTYLDNLSYL